MQQNQQNKDSIEKDLQKLRVKIDKIDNQIISALAQRMEIVKEVGMIKEENKEKFFVRSAREADMIKDLLKKDFGDFPSSEIVNIWRKLISSANAYEQDLKIGLYNPHNISDYHYLVRNYYNDKIEIINFSSTTNLFNEVENGQIHIAIFPILDDNPKHEISNDWWIRIANNKFSFQIYSQIPFVENKQNNFNQSQIKLVAGAIKKPEKSTEDNSLIYIEAEKEISREKILKNLQEAGFVNVKILQNANLNQLDSINFHLISVDGFILEGGEQIQSFKKLKTKSHIKIIGHFPKAVIL